MNSFNYVTIKDFFNRYSDGVELGDKEALIKKLGSVGIEYVGDLEELEYTESDLYLEGVDKMAIK